MKRPRLERKSTLKRSVVKKSTRVVSKAKKDTFASLMRFWGLPGWVKSKKQLRYTSPIERGVLWYYFSLYIRQRDKDRNCISCDQPKPDRQAGHFIPTGDCGWDEMAFSENNVHSECSNCNHNDRVKLKYEYNLDQRYGAGTAQKLKDQYHEYRKSSGHKNWNRATLTEKIAHYKALLEKE